LKVVAEAVKGNHCWSRRTLEFPSEQELSRLGELL